MRLPGADLDHGEVVLARARPWPLLCWLRYIVTFGLYELWRRHDYVALTDRRIIRGRGIILSKEQRSLPLDRVQDATYVRSGIVGTVEISTAGGGLGVLGVGRLRPATAKRFAAAVRAQQTTRVSSAGSAV